MQLPVSPVGTPASATLDPCNAPLVTVASMLVTSPPTVTLQLIVDVSPVFHVDCTVPLALASTPLTPAATHASMPVPDTGPVAPVYGTPVSSDEHGVNGEAARP